MYIGVVDACTNSTKDVWVFGLMVAARLCYTYSPANFYVCNHHIWPDICEALRSLYFFVFCSVAKSIIPWKTHENSLRSLVVGVLANILFLVHSSLSFQRRQATLGSTPSVGVATSVSGLLHVGNSQHRTNLHRRMALSRLWRFSLVPC